MLRSLYTATTGMMVQRNKMDTLTNNITNVDTIGYKKEELMSRSFEDMLLVRINDPNMIMNNEVGDFGPGIYVDEILTNFEQGALEPTGLMTDLAIEGDGFFRVATENGERYTRSGNFRVDLEGFLVDPNGNYVLSNQGTNINVGLSDFAVAADGQVTVDGAVIGTIDVVNFQDVDGLRKEGNNLYYHYSNEVPTTSDSYIVRQGSIEGSNVNIADEMVDMITTSSAYESCQKAAQMIDETLSKTVNDIANF